MVYFDNAATGFPKSNGVFEAIKNAYYSAANAGRSGHVLSVRAAETVFECRENIAKAFGAESENVVLCPSATYALNMAIKGLAKAGEDNVTSFFEHNAVLRPLYSLRKFGCKLKFFAPDFENPLKTLESFKSVLKPSVRLVVITHASNVNGGMLPVAEITAESKKVGAIVIVDCSQSAGHLPINVKELGADVVCFAGHKGIGGPMGTGVMIVNPNSKLCFSTLIEGGTGTASMDKTMPEFLPERLEPGTLNVTGFAGLAQAVAELDYSIEKERCMQRKIIDGLKKINGIKLYTEPKNYENYLPIVLFNKSGFTAETFAERLSEHGICVRGGLHCAPLAHAALGTGSSGAVRVSLGKGNSESEIEFFLKAVDSIG